jgi:hypothetical protein
MAKWEVEVTFEPTGDTMNFEYVTETEDEEQVFMELANKIEIVPNLVETNL